MANSSWAKADSAFLIRRGGGRGGRGGLIEKFSCQILGNSRSAILVIICQVAVTSSYDNEYL